MMKEYKVVIETLSGQIFTDIVQSKSTSSTLCERIFNQTPNVRSVEVKLHV